MHLANQILVKKIYLKTQTFIKVKKDLRFFFVCFFILKSIFLDVIIVAMRQEFDLEQEIALNIEFNQRDFIIEKQLPR